MFKKNNSINIDNSFNFDISNLINNKTLLIYINRTSRKYYSYRINKRHNSKIKKRRRYFNLPIKLKRKKLCTSMFVSSSNKLCKSSQELSRTISQELSRTILQKKYLPSSKDNDLIKKYFCYAHSNDFSICNIYGCGGITKEQYDKIKIESYSYLM